MVPSPLIKALDIANWGASSSVTVRDFGSCSSFGSFITSISCPL